MSTHRNAPYREALEQTEHRPWPLPEGRPAMVMAWLDLLFAHWPVEPERLQPLLPEGLVLDTFDGRAWLGVVTFHMADVRPPWCPPLPWVSAFAELNVRTYVRARGSRSGERSAGKPGVWFFSLDAANPLAVRVARWTFHLPYFDAEMEIAREVAASGDWFHYQSRRTHRGAPEGVFRARYRPSGQVYRAEPGALDHWLTERYCLYAADRRGRLHRGEVHHAPWPLQRAEAEIEEDTLTEPLAAMGVDVGRPGPPALLHFARRLDVVAWRARRV